MGNFEDLKNLTDACHKLGMKVMLDGVFNHVGVENELFQKALNGDKTYKDWFDFDDKYPEGVRLWADAKSLPELNLENDVVKKLYL